MPRGLYKRKRKDGMYWAYRFQAGGVTYSKTTGLRATKSNQAAARREMEAHRKTVKSPKSLTAVAFTEAAERFLGWSRMEHRDHPNTARRQAVSLTSAKQAFATAMLHEITPGQVEEYKVHRRSRKILDVTLRKDLLTLSQVFAFGLKHHWCARNPVKDVQIPSDQDSRNERTITPAEELLYFAEAGRQNPTLHDVGRLILWQGLRPDEALSLRSEDVDLETRTLFVSRGKTRAARRELYLTEESARIVARRQGKHLFPGGRWRYAGHPYSYSGLVKAHNAVLDKIPVESFDIYSLRHTFATRFYEATKDLDKLARILGHANLATVRRYVNPTREDLRGAMKSFESSYSFRAVDSTKLHEKPTVLGPGQEDTTTKGGEVKPNEIN